MKEFANLSIENETSGSNQGSTSVQMREKRIHDASGEDHGENSDLSTFPSKIGTVDVAKKCVGGSSIKACRDEGKENEQNLLNVISETSSESNHGPLTKKLKATHFTPIQNLLHKTCAASDPNLAYYYVTSKWEIENAQRGLQATPENDDEVKSLLASFGQSLERAGETPADRQARLKDHQLMLGEDAWKENEELHVQSVNLNDSFSAKRRRIGIIEEHLRPSPFILSGSVGMNPLLCSHFNQDTTLLLTGSKLGQSFVWSVPDLQIVRAFHGHQQNVSGCEFSPTAMTTSCCNESAMATCSYDGTVKLWCRCNQEPLMSIPICTGQYHLTGLAFHPSGRFLGVSSTDNCWYHLNVEIQTGHRYEGHSKAVQAIAIESGGNLILTGGLDKTICLWDIRDRSNNVMQLYYPHPHVDGIYAVDFSPNGHRIITGSADSSCKIWDVRSRQVIKTMVSHDDVVSDAKYQKINGSYIVTSSLDGMIKSWNSEGEQKMTMQVSSIVTSVDISSDERYVCATSSDGTVTIIN